MGRFSPQVLPDAGPSFAENLANALGQGFQSYQGFKAKREADEDRDRRNGLQEDELALQGIMPPGWTPPVAEQPLVEQQPQRPDYVPFDEVMTGPPDETGGFGGVDPQAAAPEPRSASGHPGGWDPVSRTFAKVPPRLPDPITLPSGRVYDAGGQMRQRIAQAMMQKEAELEAGRASRGAESATRYQSLRGLIGQPGYEKLTDAIARAAAEDPAAYREIVGNESQGWQPGSMAEELSLHGAKAEQTARANAKHRQPSAADRPETGVAAREKGADEFAYRMVAAAGGDPGAGLSLGLRDRATAAKLGVRLDHYYAAAQRYKDRLTSKSKPEDTTLEDLLRDDPDTKTNTSSGNPAPNATKSPAAPDEVIDALDQEFAGDIQKIRTELKRRGFDPDA